MEYVLTEEGKRKVAVFIKECEAKRKEILDAGLDTAEDTQIPTEADILSDLNNGVEVDEDGDYYNAWGVTDNYCSDRACELAIGEDFVSNTTRVQVTLRKTIEVTEYFDATPEDLEMIERGENPFFGKMDFTYGRIKVPALRTGIYSGRYGVKFDHPADPGQRV